MKSESKRRERKAVNLWLAETGFPLKPVLYMKEAGEVQQKHSSEKTKRRDKWE